MAKRAQASTRDVAFARFMTAVKSPTTATWDDVREAHGWGHIRSQDDMFAFVGLVAKALWKLPGNERARFARAIFARASEWERAPVGSNPDVWPIRIDVVPDE